ncbi:hypothetical protein Daura_42180 [Dactylosporangium aurantiacum]|uniref:Uncharacterized protein n=1 Tax=Dactylosporangium aurantiacum TaxID=35754 RepID=A0A9Q9II90_9ACTN|nr:hypothetical protein [Dactylosporangium aurantiacum]MDG6102613.1 hypothetical protein [Dactylosporangium aurantiacum]UWZ53130.1 hypothetical protein Daura_42180 [Dactylosporangium aurantiacum]
MSEYDGGDTGAEFGHVETGEDHQSLEQLHQVNASEADYNNQFNVYEQNHAAAESTSFDQGHSVEFTGADGSHYAESNFTSYDHAAAESDHVFAAEGSESSHEAQFSQLDALQAQLDSAFSEATVIDTDTPPSIAAG